MRLFMAILFAPAQLDRLQALTQELAALARRSSPTRREHLHLTLCFLGETERLAAAKRALQALSAPPLLLQGGRLGRFRRSDGDLVWLGLQPNPALQALQAQLAAYLRAEGFALEERPYQPHITLLRRAQLATAGAWPQRESGLLAEVQAVSLMLSERTAGGLSYRELARQPLLPA